MSFAEGLLSGIAGGMVGAGQAAADITKRDSDNAAKLDMEAQAEQMRSEVLLARQKALDEYRRGVDAKDIQAIDSQAQRDLATKELRKLGGGDLSAEEVQALKDNPQSVEAYRQAGAKGLLNYGRRDELKAKIDAASGIRPDMAKDFRSDLKDLNAEEMLVLKERDTASKEKRDAAIADKAARSGGSGSAESNGGVEGWQYRQWKQENPSGSYTKFKEWMSDSRYNKDKAVMEMATKLLAGNQYPTDEDVQAAMNTADKLVNRKSAQPANSERNSGKTDRPPLGTFFR